MLVLIRKLQMLIGKWLAGKQTAPAKQTVPGKPCPVCGEPLVGEGHYACKWPTQEDQVRGP